jgi:hypothetical protein
MINIEQITLKLGQLSLETLGKESGFIKREKKLTAIGFVMSFFSSFSEGSEGQTIKWAEKLSVLIGKPITQQGLGKRIGWLCVRFCEQILAQSIAYTLSKAITWSHEAKWLKSFNRILIEDSTALKLPKLLYGIYGGGTNQKESYAIARVQLRMELKTERIENLEVRSYSENDVSFASNIIKGLQKGDLVIRDLGYFLVSVFKEIELKSAFFITRWHPRVKFRCIKTKATWDLSKILSDAERKCLTYIDKQAFLSLEDEFIVRFVAIKLPQDVEAKRRQAALDKSKKKGVTYNEKYFEHLGWAIYITNIPIEMFDFSAIWSIYRLRWRIEIIFKAWKSHLKILQTLKDWQYQNPCQIIVRIYLIMVWIVLCLVPAYNFFSYQLYKMEQRHLSLAKFADYYTRNFLSICDEAYATERNFL